MGNTIYIQETNKKPTKTCSTYELVLVRECSIQPSHTIQMKQQQTQYNKSMINLSYKIRYMKVDKLFEFHFISVVVVI